MPKNQPKILPIEDDQFLIKAYQDGLESAGFHVLVAPDGLRALEMLTLQHLEPDLILLDLVLPVLDGFEVLKEIKSNHHLNHIPVLILSNLGQQSDIKKAKKLGANDYLIKANYSMSGVIEKARSYLKG